MINKVTEKTLSDVINIVKERKIKFIKVTQQGDSYYVEYEEAESNDSDKMVELLVHLEDFQNGLQTGTLSSFYLYYHVVIDMVIININKTSNDVCKQIDPVVSILNDLSNILKNLNKTDLDKVTLTEGKKKFTSNYNKIISKLIAEVKSSL